MQASTQNLITFDNNQNLFRIRIDTTIPNNIWQIGKPQKATFTSAYSLPNAIVTDTINTYPINNISVFYLGTGGDWGKNPNFHSVTIDFFYRVDCDSLLDFGKIELSIDTGKTWINVVKNGLFQVYDNNGNIKEETPTSDTIVFTGWTNGWFHFYHQYLNIPWGVQIDTVIYKFTFHSSNLIANRDGWVLDNIHYRDYWESITEKSNSFSYCPNPVNSVLYIDSKFSIIDIEIFNLLGINLKKIISNSYMSTIDVSNLQPGLYNFQINFQNGTRSFGKFIKY